MNKIILIGRTTRDPELRYTPNGAAVCSFTLAVDRPFNSQSGEREADFIDCIVWNKVAENVAKYIVKGRQLAVEGRLQIRSYDDKDGVRRWRSEVIANHVEFLGNGQGQQQQPQQEQPPYATPSNTPVSQGSFGGIGTEVNFNDEDLPF